MSSLVGGIFLVGFAVKILHATSQQIGLLAALPMLASFSQIIGSIFIEKTGKRKLICVFFAFLNRILWLLVILMPLKIFASYTDIRIWIVIGVVTCSGFFGALSGVAWLSWMSAIVPKRLLGSYFGRRNIIAAGCGMFAVLAGGKFLTWWATHHGADDPWAFAILFVIGLASGLAALWFLSMMPEIPMSKKEGAFQYSVFLHPLKDINFQKLIIYVSLWIFSIQLASPFYGMYMINNLKMNFSAITIMGTLATLSTLFMMKIWGPISDKLGNKPILIVAGWFSLISPVIWIFTAPKHYYIPILIAHILSGAFMAGIALSQFNILIKLSPKEGKSVYLALFATITGVSGAVAPIIGGYLLKWLSSAQINFYQYNFTNMQMLFFISALLQLLSIIFVFKVCEPASSTPVAVIMRLKNDLNPQTGVSSATDFAMINMKKGNDIIKSIDQVSEKLANTSEAKIEKIIDKVTPRFNVIKRLIEYLRKDD